MAGSSYYYSIYSGYASQVRSLANNISSLQSIRNQLSSGLGSKQSNVNSRLDDLEEDLDDAVRHDGTYTTYITSIREDYEEKSSGSDCCLSGALSALESEITALQNQKARAESDRDNAYRQYQEALAQEYRSRWNR